MKIRQTLTLIFASGLLFFSSCLKDDPNGSNTTLFYGHQDIPNINYYMPRPLLLLDTLNDMNLLHFGENPPKMLFDSCYNNDTTIVFAFSNHCFGMTSLSFKEKFDDGTKESSNTDDTYKFMTENKRWEELLNDTLLPIFFDTAFNGTTAKDPEVLRHAYIMGNDPDFTLYYYEVLKEHQQLQPLNAIILSGTVVYKQFPIIDTIKPDRITRDSIPNDTINNDPPVVNDTTNINPSDNDSIVIVYDSIPQYLIDVKMGVKTLKYFPKNNTQAPTIPDINIKSFDTLFIKTSKNR